MSERAIFIRFQCRARARARRSHYICVHHGFEICYVFSLHPPSLPLFASRAPARDATTRVSARVYSTIRFDNDASATARRAATRNTPLAAQTPVWQAVSLGGRMCHPIVIGKVLQSHYGQGRVRTQPWRLGSYDILGADDKQQPYVESEPAAPHITRKRRRHNAT